MSDVPWNGRKSDNRGTISRIEALVASHPQASLIHGHWQNEMDQRNFGLDVLYREGIENCLVIDADEIYHTGQLEKMFRVIEHLPQFSAFHIEWNTYWSQNYYRIEPREPYKPLVVVSTRHFLFTEIRTGVTTVRRSAEGVQVQEGAQTYNAAFIPPEVCICYHLSYCRSDEMMRRKLETNSHAKQFLPNWFENVWSRWTPEMENLHPVQPEWYKRAVQEDLSSVPLALQNYIQTGRGGRGAPKLAR